jgi:hypothetical protein
VLALPIRSTIAQCSCRRCRCVKSDQPIPVFASRSQATRENRAVPLAFEGLGIRRFPELARLLCPVSKPHAQFLDVLSPDECRRKFRAEQAGICRRISIRAASGSRAGQLSPPRCRRRSGRDRRRSSSPWTGTPRSPATLQSPDVNRSGVESAQNQSAGMSAMTDPS